MATKRKIHSREFKEQAVQLLNTSGKPGNQIEAELGIGTGIMYRWRRHLQENGVGAFPGNGNERDKELWELRRQKDVEIVDEIRETQSVCSKVPGCS